MTVTTTTVRSWGAISLGAIFAFGTAYVLFADVRSLDAITTDHVMTALVLIGTIAAGHWFWPQLMAMRLLPALGLGLLFVAGTFICVTGSAGRSAEVSQKREAEANHVNGGRKAVEDDLKKAKAERDAQSAKFAAECATGKGSRCGGQKATLEYIDSHIAILEVRLDNMKPEQQANGGLKHAAKVFALALPGSSEQIEGVLILLWPFAKALMLEVATIVFLGLGLGHERVSSKKRKAPGSATVSELETELDPLIAALARARRPVSNDELARLMRVSKGQASKLVARAQAVGLVRKDRAGREVAIRIESLH